MNTPLQDLRAGLAYLPPKMHSIDARALLLAIQAQENPKRQAQQTGGPAVGDYQFERGGISGVLRHKASGALAREVCAKFGVEPTVDAVYLAIRDGRPELDAIFARLLLWTDALPLPKLGDVEGGWQCYMRTWRPGAAQRDYDGLRKKWSVNYAKAMEVLR